ncbi:hypothetical protein [Bdellovibrio sp. HCB2-146]|uniref:hypothetical protein n=1 Tax=Bdellovibrio sp. HCB2-146 TaxID=3394362 RepID=UPI0039BD6B63
MSLFASSLAVITLFASLSYAQSSTSASTTSLHDMALSEATQIKGKQKEQASDAQVAGAYLTLKDPRPEIITRRWKYFASLSVQTFQAEGSATNDLAETFDLSQNDQTVMPTLELGMISSPLLTGPVAWKLGARAQGSFISQEANAVLASGVQVDDARLNTTLLSAGPVLAVSWERLAWLSVVVSPQYGIVNYTQSSTNDSAAFSKHARYEALNYGLDFQVSPKWSIFTEWSNKSINDNETIALQKNNFELGTKVQW